MLNCEIKKQNRQPSTPHPLGQAFSTFFGGGAFTCGRLAGRGVGAVPAQSRQAKKMWFHSFIVLDWCVFTFAQTIVPRKDGKQRV